MATTCAPDGAKIYSFYLIPQNKIVLVDLLEREPLSCLPVLDQVYCAVRPVGHELDNLKVFLTRWLCLELDLWTNEKSVLTVLTNERPVFRSRD